MISQSAYRGYYTRRNIKMKIEEEEERKQMDYLDPRETIQAVAWLDMMFDDSGLTKEQANQAASIIQKAFRNYRGRRNSKEAPKITSSRSLVVEAIVDNLHQKVFKNILDRDDFPKELGSREKLSESIDKVHSAYKELLRRSQYSEGETKTKEDKLTDLEKDELVQKKIDLEESKEEIEIFDVEKIGEKIEEIKDQEEVAGSKEVQEKQDQEEEENREDQENEKDEENQEDQFPGNEAHTDHVHHDQEE